MSILPTRVPAALAALLLAGTALPAWAQQQAAQPPADAAAPTPTPAPAASDTDAATAPEATPAPPQTDILSGRTLSVLLDARLVAVDGHKSFLDAGFGKTRFSGPANGDFKVIPAPIEADLIWTPRFTSSLAANVSASWQRDQEDAVDLMEAFVTFLPPRGKIGFSAKAGLYWPEISLEHATGGAWSTVHTLTPSAINSWVGEETKVLGAEATLTASIGAHDFSATGGVFGFNDTSGTLLSFRGWALHDLKATAFGHFQLPTLSSFMVVLQAQTTRSLLEIDKRAGFYGRLEWRPPVPVTINAFYYDNRGDPMAFNPSLQWGWRTRFLNLGLAADLAPGTKLLAQAMQGTTQMGFTPKNATRPWVDTQFRSAYVLLAQQIGRGEISGRFELFDTHERGSRMSPDESENGGALTIAGRWALTDILTGFVEAMQVRSHRGTRTRLGLSPFEAQTVIQLGLRLRL